MATCPHCDDNLADSSARFCSACGGALGTAASPTPTPADPEKTLFDGRPAVFYSIGTVGLSIITAGIAALGYWLHALGRQYRITTHRIIFEQGILSKRLEQIDLFRVVDFVVERPFGQRLMGTGNLIIQSMDKSMPYLKIRGIKTDVRDLYEQLRVATESEKRRHGVRLVDYE